MSRQALEASQSVGNSGTAFVILYYLPSSFCNMLAGNLALASQTGSRQTEHFEEAVKPPVKPPLLCPHLSRQAS